MSNSRKFIWIVIFLTIEKKTRKEPVSRKTRQELKVSKLFEINEENKFLSKNYVWFMSIQELKENDRNVVKKLQKWFDVEFTFG